MLREMQNLSLIDEVGKSPDSSLAWTSSQSKHKSLCTPLSKGPGAKAVI